MTPYVRSFVIAIDGPSASGKGTLARGLAQRLDYAYLDTGALYRLVAKTMLEAGQDPNNDSLAEQTARALAQHLTPRLLQDAGLRTDAVGQGASIVAKNQPVRDALLDMQRNFAQNPRHDDGTPAAGVVMDGRDIGTVICPDAPLKLFVTASPEERARRRFLELTQRGEQTDFSTVVADMARRDARDSGRDAAPLKPADDAVILDTSQMTAQEVLEKAFALAQKRGTTLKAN